MLSAVLSFPKTYNNKTVIFPKTTAAKRDGTTGRSTLTNVHRNGRRKTLDASLLEAKE